MIQTFSARDFQGLRKIDLDLGGFNVLYGANGAGKTSIADAVLHALTGDVPRGSVVADVIRAGAKKASVEVMVGDKRGVIRETTAKARSVMVDGIEVPAKDADAAVRKMIGASVPAIRAALKGGALLDMKPADRLALLAEITGATFAPALAPDVVAAIARLGIEAPKSLADLDLVADRAIEKRKDGKRVAAEQQADLDRLPSVPAHLVGKTFDLADLRRRRDAAMVARPDVAAIELRLAELGTATRVPVPSTDAASRDLVRAEDAVKTAKSLVAQLSAAPAVPESKVSVEDAKAAVEKAQAELVRIEKSLESMRADHARATRMEAAIAKGGHCETCGQGLSAELAADAAKATAAILKQGKVFAAERDAASAKVESARLALVAAEKAAEARRHATALREAKEAVPAAEAKFTEAEAAFRRVQSLKVAAEAENTKAAEIDRLRAELTRAATPSPVSIADLDRQIADAESVAAARPAERARAEKSLASANERAADGDLVEKACKAAKVDLVRGALHPFTDAANAAIAALGLGFTLSWDGLDPIVSGMPVSRLSDGERTRVLYAMQLAVVRLARVPLLILDRAELVDDAGKKEIKKLASACAAEGIQVLMLTCAPAPAQLDARFRGFVVADGEASPIPVAAKAA